MARERQKPRLDTIGDVYYAIWFDTAKNRQARMSLKTSDPAEAASRFAAALMQGLGTASWDSPNEAVKTAGLTVDDVLDIYLTKHVNAEGSKVASPERIEFCVANVKKGMGCLALKDVGVPECQEYRASRRSGKIGRPSQDGTIRRELGVLRAAAAVALKWRQVTQAEMPVIELPAAPDAKDRWLTKAELAALFAAARGRTLDWMTMAYYTAARKEAILSLKWVQVDVVHNRIMLNPAGRRRTKKGRPTIPIAAELIPLLERLKAENDAREVPSEFVLTNDGSIRRSFESAVKRAGLVNVTPHTLRHTRATHLLQDGVDPWAVAGLLGDTLATVSKTYGHHSSGHLAEVLGAR